MRERTKSSGVEGSRRAIGNPESCESKGKGEGGDGEVEEGERTIIELHVVLRRRRETT